MRELQRYISDFFVSAAAACGQCSLRLPLKEQAHDVLALIRALDSAPGLLLHWTDMPRWDRTNLAALIDVKGNRVWGEYVNQFVTGIWYYGDLSVYYQLVVELKDTAAEPWMLEKSGSNSARQDDSVHENRPHQKSEAVKKWLEMVGLQNIDRDLDSVQIQVAETEKSAVCQTNTT